MTHAMTRHDTRHDTHHDTHTMAQAMELVLRRSYDTLSRVFKYYAAGGEV